jgi:ferredoxin, 2Fe-2S
MLLRIIDREGKEHELNVSPASTLMEALREFDWGVAAICGGQCACATCHVYVAPEWINRLPWPHNDEHELVMHLQHWRENSRLSCQILLVSELDNLSVTLAPEE